MQIITVEEGFNSGRTYYLQASSEDECKDMTEVLKRMAKVARKRAEAKSKFRKIQEKVLKFYDSTPFQCGVAFLIIAVR